MNGRWRRTVINLTGLAATATTVFFGPFSYYGNLFAAAGVMIATGVLSHWMLRLGGRNSRERTGGSGDHGKP